MSIIVRLIIKEWITAFIGACVVMLLLISIADIISELMRGVTTVNDIVLHYLLEVPKWLIKIFPVGTMMATLFMLHKFQRKSELIAIFALGVSRVSLLSTIFILSLFVGILQFYNGAYLGAFFEFQKKKMLRDGGIHFRKDKTPELKAFSSKGDGFWFKNKSYFCSFEIFDKQKSEMHNVAYYFYSEDFKLTEVIWAKSASYVSGLLWKFKDGEVVSSLQQKSFPKGEVFKERSVHLLERPQDFKDLNIEILELNYPNLKSYIGKLDRLGISSEEYETLLYDKVAAAVICLIFSFIPVEAIFTPNRRNNSFGKTIFIVIVVTLLFWLSYSSFFALGTGGKLPPVVATFIIPLLTFSYLLWYFYRKRNLT